MASADMFRFVCL